MSIVIFNPTSEDFEMTYAGRNMVLAAGQKLKVEDSAGKHLLNAFGPRGLCSLEFEDDVEEVSIGGMARNKAFKKRMVMEHNHRNVARKQQGFGYTSPSPYVKAAATELGIQLDEPYSLKDGEQERMKKMEDENTNLKNMVMNLTTQMESMVSSIQEAQGKKEKSAK